MVRRLALVVALILAAVPARGDVLVVVHDAYAPNSNKALAPLWDLLNRGLAPGVHVQVSNADSWTLAELRDSVYAFSNTPRYRAHLMVIVGADRNQVIIDATKAGRLALSQLSKSANRPRVPVLFINTSDEASFQSGGNCSLGVAGVQITQPQGDSSLAYSPSGYQFPVDAWGWTKDVAGAYPAMGSYVTPVLSLACYKSTRANPLGVGGYNSHPGTQSDTLFAWFYNPPNNTTYTDRTTAGFGVMSWAPVATISGINYPEGSMAAVAVGMAARLAPTQFAFPAASVAVEVDDGVKRFGGQASAPQVLDALGGIDSLGIGQPARCRIPFTYGIEVDSITTVESGSTRFAIEWARVKASGGKVTVHNHRGTTVADSTQTASAASGDYSDIFGVANSRYAFGTSAATRDESTYSLLKGATNKLIAYAGGRPYVSFSVMPPTDDYSSLLMGTAGYYKSTFDSLGYAVALAGYRVIRTQYSGSSASVQFGGGVGGMPFGRTWELPASRTLAAALDPPSQYAPRSILYAASGYLYGSTTDTANTSTALAGLRIGMNTHLARAFGYNRNVDLTTAQEGSAVAPQPAYYGTTREAIWVTHLPNFRHNLAQSVEANPYGTQRPGWQAVRMVHAVMMAARWAACASGNCAGPVEWHYADEVTERDVR